MTCDVLDEADGQGARAPRLHHADVFPLAWEQKFEAYLIQSPSTTVLIGAGRYRESRTYATFLLRWVRRFAPSASLW